MFAIRKERCIVKRLKEIQFDQAGEMQCWLESDAASTSSSHQFYDSAYFGFVPPSFVKGMYAAGAAADSSKKMMTLFRESSCHPFSSSSCSPILIDDELSLVFSLNRPNRQENCVSNCGDHCRSQHRVEHFG